MTRTIAARWTFVAVLVAALAAAVAWWQPWRPGTFPSAPVRTATQPTPPHPFGFVDAPAEATITGTRVQLRGWAHAAQGIARIEVRLDDETREARYGLPRPDVAYAYPSVPDAGRGGFDFDADFAGRITGRHRLTVIAVDRAGAAHELARKSVIAPSALARWKPLLDARPRLAQPPFHLLPATSGILVHGADGIRETYAPFASSTMQVGMRVPILYLRTTRGREHDWEFDPEWDIDRRCGERRIADDSLAAVIAFAEANRLPVLFTLNGGVWADASCDVPDWDVNDELERDARLCQWTANGTVPPDDALRNLAGSLGSPEIARALTLNVYAGKVRAYKRRNLEAAARIIAAFGARHPDLLVGVSLDPDVYVLPWFQGREWFDFNPDTIRQFRHWLRGTGPYAGRDEPGVPDLSAFRRTKPLTLAEVRAVARRPFARWDDVDPPRTFPPHGQPGHASAWNDPWRVLWDEFRRHLVHVHYSELADWVVASGIPAEKVFTAQAFTAPDRGFLPQSIGIEGATTDYDSGGVSVEGAIPRRGRLGVILYGESTSNIVNTPTREPQFRIFERMAGRWGVVEFSTASLKDLGYRPGYADAYRAFREIANGGGLLVSPMAWNGWNGIYAAQPGYQAYTSWRNTPAEEAALDLLVERANLPSAAKLWTFGSPQHRDADGWTAHAPAVLAVGAGHVDVSDAGRTTTLESPPGQFIRADRFDLLVLGLADDTAVDAVSVAGRLDGTQRWVTLAPRVRVDTLAASPAGRTIPLAWPAGTTVVDQLRIELVRANATGTLRIDHVALYPRDEPPR